MTGSIPRHRNPSSSRTSLPVRTDPSRYSRTVPHAPPTIAPISAERTIVMMGFGWLGCSGGAAGVTTRASLNGKDCCWIVC